MVTEIVEEESGVRGMYIMGENPVHLRPGRRPRRALVPGASNSWWCTTCSSHGDARYADVVLPGSSFAEKTGTFVNTERRIQPRQESGYQPGQARGDLEILIDLSNRLGLKTRFETSEEVMREIARVTPSWRGVTYQRLEGAGLQYRCRRADSTGTSFLVRRPVPTAQTGRACSFPSNTRRRRTPRRGVPVRG